MSKIVLIEYKDVLSFFLSQFSSTLGSYQKHVERIHHSELDKLEESSPSICIIEVGPDGKIGEKLQKWALRAGAPRIYLAFFSQTLSPEGRVTLRNTFASGPRIEGAVDLSLEKEFHLPLATSLAREMNRDSEQKLDASDLIRLNDELNSVVTEVQQELHRVKKIHEHLVPKRVQNFKGVKIESKYAVGERSGGEFFDLVHNSGQVTFVLSSSSSYVATSFVLKAFSELSNLVPGKQDIQQFISTVSKDVRDFSNGLYIGN